MPPGRPRPLDDSRSETSSTIGLIKERNNPGVVVSSGVSKNKRIANISQPGPLKPHVNGAPVPTARAEQTDPSLPRTDWNALSPSFLRTYRTAYRLPTSSAYTYPHADLIHNSSRSALRSPSTVLARRRLRDLKHQRRKAAISEASSGNPPVNGRSKQKEKENNSEHLLKPPSPEHPNAYSQTLNGASDTSNSISQSQHPSLPTPNIPPEHIGKQTPLVLATAARKHFNAQQLSEIETIARFSYVVRQTRNRETMKMEGSDGDGTGYWMGSQGRETRRGEGGEVGFRLRFRP